MNMFFRILIVALNLILSPILLVIMLAWLTVEHVIRYLRDETVLTYVELLHAYFEGLRKGLHMHAEFFKNGDFYEAFGDILD